MRKVYLCLLAASVLLCLIVFPITAKAATPWLHVDGKYIKDPSGNVVILRGVDTQALKGQIQTTVKGNNNGFNGLIDIITNTNDNSGNSPGWYTRVVRLCVDVYGNDSYTTNPNDYVNNVLKPCVEYATKKGLYVIIDLHYVDDTSAAGNVVNQFWTQVAPIYKNYPNVLYEVYNEPINKSQSWSQFKPIMQAWVNLIRSYAPNNLILAGSPIWDQQMGDAATDPLTGGNIVYVAHMYYSHFKTQWNHDQIEKCGAVHPIIFTEWGFESTPSYPAETIASYGQPMMEWFDSRGFSWTAWCADNDWAPPMFYDDWSLRVGPGESGGFVKDALYKRRNLNQPVDNGVITPPATLTQTPTPTPTKSPTPIPTQDNSSNLAFGKTANSDSEETAKGNIASNANDGEVLTRWCAADSGLNHWLKVDLGSNYNLTGTEVMWELGGVNYKYKIDLSSDNINWTTAVDKTNSTSTVQNQSDTFTANNIRYVRITVTGLPADTWASIDEFRVFGKPGTVIKGPDINGDGVINMADVIILATVFNAVRGDIRYVEAYDLNGDSSINMTDIIAIAAKFNTIVISSTNTPTSTPTKAPTVTPTAGTRVLPEVSTVDKDGPFTVVTDQNTGPSGKGVVVRPANLCSLGVTKHPIIIWGPGGGSEPSSCQQVLNRLASMGFVVYSEASTGNGSEMKAGLDWIISLNSKSSSPYYNKLDTSRVGAAGHSLGGLSALGIASDSRISTTMLVNSGSFDGNGSKNYRKPAAIIYGTGGEIAGENAQRDYRNATVPIWLGGIKGGGHGSGIYEGLPAIAAWLRWHVAGETERKSMFIGTNAVFNTGIWQSQYKNW